MTNNILVKVNGKAEDNIKSRVSVKELDSRLFKDKKKGIIRGEQWFRDANLWYELVISYNNPYNHRRVHSELYLLHEERENLADLIKDSTLLFYGVGIGETEIELIDWELERANYVEAVGIDVNNKFIRKFIGGLRNKTKENPEYQIMFKGYNALFEQLQPRDFIFGNSRYKRKAHICLGHSIGNYADQGEIFQLFASNSQKRDLLVLGFQLDTDIDILFNKYSTNQEFVNLILNWEKSPDYSKLEWNLDRENGIIRAKYDNLEIFRSKKYNPKNLRGFVNNFGYELKFEVIDDDRNSCIQVYERK